MDRVKVVVRYPDNRLLKGYTFNFNPDSPFIDIFPAASGPEGEAIQVEANDLKAIFFVRDFEGNPSYNDRRFVPDGEWLTGRKVEVTFTDGEVLLGTTMGYDPRRIGFFVFPIDPRSNNLRVFVVNRSTRSVRYVRLDERPQAAAGSPLGRMNVLLSQPHNVLSIPAEYNPAISMMWPMLVVFLSGIAATYAMSLSSSNLREIRPIAPVTAMALGYAPGTSVQIKRGAMVYATPGSPPVAPEAVLAGTGTVLERLRFQNQWMYQVRTADRAGWVAEPDLLPAPSR